MTEARLASDRVADYYDRNTAAFLRFGGAGDTAAIHRKIWAPGVATETQAFEYLNALVGSEVIPSGSSCPARLLDLGCGVGGTAAWLAERQDVSVVGVSNSPVQVSAARQRARRLGLDERCRFLLADFTALPPLGPFDGAYAIEAFIHTPDPGRFFASVAEQLAPGGLLVICDDFLAESATSPPAQSEAWRGLQRFRLNWQAINLNTAASAAETARSYGLRLVEQRDLTPYLKPFHPFVLRALYAATRLPLRWAYWQNLSGGSALQVCTQRGWIRYLVLTFEMEGTCTPSPSSATLSPSIT